MHASFLLTAIALLPFSLAAPAPPPPPHGRPPFPRPSPISGRQKTTTSPAVSVASAAASAVASAPASASAAASCGLSGVAQPANTLTPPTSDMQLILVALGHGTQNYTCANATSTPAAIGAVAQLFNASCELAGNPSATTASLGSIEESEAAIGAHFFVDSTTPDFDIIGLGNTEAKKAEEIVSPDGAANVKWLRLEAQAQGSTSAVKEVYRLNTVGGVAPSTCEGRAAGEVVTVDYEAQYWVYV